VSPPPGCALYDAAALRATGALAFWPDGEGMRMVTAADRAGNRPWNRR
jgi:competence protein ComEC